MTVQFTKSDLRLLTEAEIDRISGGQDNPEIVVWGHRDFSGAIIGFTTGTAGGEPPRLETDANQLEPESEQGLPPIPVMVSVSNPANQARAEEAARKLILAIAEVLRKLNSTDRSVKFQFAGKTYTVGEVLDDINNTDYSVSDDTDFGNNGVGKSIHGLNGERHRDIINFEAVLNGYGRPSDNLGLISLIFHEHGHLSVPGYEFLVLNFATYNREPETVRGEWKNSEYARNVEKFANEFLVAATGAAQITYGFVPDPGVGSVDPDTIFDRRRAERASE